MKQPKLYPLVALPNHPPLQQRRKIPMIHPLVAIPIDNDEYEQRQQSIRSTKQNQINSKIEQKNDHISRHEKAEKGGREPPQKVIRRRSCSIKPSVESIKEDENDE